MNETQGSPEPRRACLRSLANRVGECNQLVCARAAPSQKLLCSLHGKRGVLFCQCSRLDYPVRRADKSHHLRDHCVVNSSPHPRGSCCPLSKTGFKQIA